MPLALRRAQISRANLDRADRRVLEATAARKPCAAALIRGMYAGWVSSDDSAGSSALLCPRCESPALVVCSRVELAPDENWDERSFQIIFCSTCGFEGIAIYLESRHGSMGSEMLQHNAYTTDLGRLAQISALVAQCPDPSNRRCDCPSHQGLNQLTGDSERARFASPDNAIIRFIGPLRYGNLERRRQ